MLGEPDLILRDMSDGVVVIDAKGRLKTINPAARALLELGDAELSGSFSSLFRRSAKTPSSSART